MKHWKKAILSLAALAVAVPASAFAASSASDSSTQVSPSPAPQTNAQEHGWKQKGRHRERDGAFKGGFKGEFGFGMGMKQDASVHKKAYLNLLVEKYSPDTADAWKAALEERDELVKELQTLKSTQLQDLHPFGDKTDKDQLRAELQARKEVQKQFTDAVAANDPAAIKKALASLLEQEVKDNQQMSAKIAAFKTKSSTSSSGTAATGAGA